MSTPGRHSAFPWFLLLVLCTAATGWPLSAAAQGDAAPPLFWSWDAAEDPLLTRFEFSQQLEPAGPDQASGAPLYSVPGEDPYLVTPPGLGIDAGEASLVLLRLAARGNLGRDATVGQLYWMKEGDRGWSRAQSVFFRVMLDGEMQTCRAEVGRSPWWRGVIHQLRFDPMMEAGTLAIGSIRVTGAEGADDRRESFMHFKPVPQNQLITLTREHPSVRVPTPGFPPCRAIEISSSLNDTFGIVFGQAVARMVIEDAAGGETGILLVNGLDFADLSLPGLWKTIPGITCLGRSFYSRRRLPEIITPRAVRVELLDLPDNQGRLSLHLDRMSLQTDWVLETKSSAARARSGDEEFIGPYAAEWVFTEERGWQGWGPRKEQPPPVLDGRIALLDLALPGDALVTSEPQQIRAADVDLIEIMARVNSGVGEGRLYWATESDPRFNRRRSIRFTLDQYGSDEIYYLDVGSQPLWDGEITRLRLEPANHPVRAGVQRIRLVKAPVLRLCRARPLCLGWDEWLYTVASLLLILPLIVWLRRARGGRPGSALTVTPFRVLLVLFAALAACFPFEHYSGMRTWAGGISFTPPHLLLALLVPFRLLIGRDLSFPAADEPGGRQSRWALICFGLFLLAALAGGLLSGWPMPSLQTILFFIFPALVLLLLLASSGSWQGTGLLLRALVLCATAVSLLAAAEYVLGYNPLLHNILKICAPFYFEVPVFRAASTFIVPIALATFLLLVLPLGVWLGWRKGGCFLSRIFWSCCTLLMVVALVLTFSRGALAVLVLFAVVFLGRRKPLLLATAAVLLALALGGLALVSGTARSQLRDRFVDLGSISRSAAVVQRLAGWQSGLAMTAANPLLGVGPGNYSREAVNFGGYKGKEFLHEQYNTPDNMLIRIAAETGVTGAALVLLFLCFLFRSLLLRRRSCADESGRQLATAMIFGLAGLSANMLLFDGLYWFSLNLVAFFVAGLALGSWKE
jgi:O-antigen ligase